MASIFPFVSGQCDRLVKMEGGKKNSIFVFFCLFGRLAAGSKKQNEKRFGQK